MKQEIDLISQSALLPYRQTILAGGTLAEYVPVEVILAAPKIDAVEVVRWCTYLQAQKQGWQVRRGETGVPVEYWAYVDPAQKKWLTWSEVATIRANDPDRYNTMELRYRISTVFNGQQIEGIPELARQETIMDAAQITQIRDTVLQNMVLAYREEGSRAYYSPFDDRVTLPPMQSFDNGHA